jgi:hypothetical protein
MPAPTVELRTIQDEPAIGVSRLYSLRDQKEKPLKPLLRWSWRQWPQTDSITGWRDKSLGSDAQWLFGLSEVGSSVWCKAFGLPR